MYKGGTYDSLMIYKLVIKNEFNIKKYKYKQKQLLFNF